MKIVLAAIALCAGSAVAVAQTDVQTAQAGTIGLTYDLNSVVVVGNMDTVGSGSVASFFVRDTKSAFGAINIFLGQGDFDALGLQLGDVLDIVAGTRDSFNGFSELTFPASVTASAGAAPTNHAPIATSAADYQNLSATAEGLESQRVGVSASFADAGDVGTAWAGFTNYTFNDGLGSFFTARVATNEIADRLNGQYGNIGAGPLDLVGIFGQYSPGDDGTGYQLLLAPSPSSVALLGLGGLVATRRRRG
ncbi:MAG: hypothetical protein ACI89L_002332 [Phycisphaerales bacterium]|jgi:hypothetical protein